MLNLHVTFKHRLDTTTMDADVKAENTYPKTIREALAAQYHDGLRHVELIHVSILSRAAEETAETR